MKKKMTVLDLLKQMEHRGIYPKTVEIISARNNEVLYKDPFLHVPYIALDWFIVSYDLSEDNKYLKILSNITPYF